MAETDMKTAREILKKAAKQLPESSSGRQAVIGCGLALLEVSAELKEIRLELGTIRRMVDQVRHGKTTAAAQQTFAALASDLPPGVPKISHCRSCVAPVLWCKTSSGKMMPLDAKPVADGTFGITPAGVARKTTELGPRYDSHFSTCPNADEHRKPRDKA